VARAIDFSAVVVFGIARVARLETCWAISCASDSVADFGSAGAVFAAERLLSQQGYIVVAALAGLLLWPVAVSGLGPAQRTDGRG
jgi:hypothetical protein